ncbi:TRAP transporter substrate-binding protein DctP [Georgenia subflava]|uniref:C4-dicarboxylate ABC transporter substrate-binding protein n=1 Tax=Georgenia subflava TaxID=1622177 RepID=A0A6N7EC72_9MICO|nr:TRAP transporter substrate-binding protein DctP [Georgenia subflava]MPV35570.1 hypothetical protein [Georgenia subflava]
MRKFTNSRRNLAIGAVTLTGALALGACSGVEGAQGGSGAGGTADLQFASFLGPTTPQGAAMKSMFEEISEDEESGLSVETFWEGALLGADEMLSGVAQGRSDIGYMTVQYTPGELPLSQAATVPFQTEDWEAVETALNTMYEDDEAFNGEWQGNGVHVLTFTGTPASIYATAEPLPDFESLAGQQVRATGYTANAVDAAGGNAVALQIGEVYEAIQRGLVEGYTTMLLDTAPSLSLHEVAPHITDTGIGVYTMNVIFMNQDAWESLSDEQRQVLEDGIEAYHAEYRERLTEVEDESCQAHIDAGGGVTIWSDEDKQQWRDVVGESLIDMWKSDVEQAGGDAEAFYSTYSKLVEENPGELETGMKRCANR